MIHVYHCWIDGEWRKPFVEHLAALFQCEFDGVVVISVVGSNARAVAAITELVEGYPTPVEVRLSALEGDETASVNLCRDVARERHQPVMYAHTKGAFMSDPFHDEWRRLLTAKLIRHWRTWQPLLQRFDVIAPFYSQVGEYHGGNYWIAAERHLSRLPRCDGTDRYEPEQWIGFGDPHWYDPALSELP